MPTVAKFKFDDRTLPWALEQKMIFKYGFRTDKRAPGDYVILEKVRNKRTEFTPPVQATQTDTELTELDMTLLRRQLNAVIAMFINPEAHLDKIKVRLNNIKQIQPPGPKVKFVEEWVESWLTEIGDR